MKYLLAILALCLALSSCWNTERVLPIPADTFGWATQIDSAPPVSLAFQYYPWRMLGGYYTTWRSVNGSLFGTQCDYMRWDSTGHSLYARLRIWDGSFSTYYNLHNLWMKPKPFYADYHRDRFAAPLVVKEFAGTQAFRVEGTRRNDTLFLFSGTYPVYLWDQLQVTAIDTFVHL